MTRIAIARVGMMLARNLLGLGGVGCVVFGVHQLFAPAAWILAGAIMTAAAVALSRGAQT